VVSALLVAAAPAVPIRADESVEIEAQEVVHDLSDEQVIDLPLDAASHVALHWPGQHEARLSVAFTIDGATFGPRWPVEHDEVGESRGDGRTYGAIMNAGGATAIRVTADRPIADLAVVALDTSAPSGSAWGFGARTAAVAAQPPTISRAGWGADESLRFDADGAEIWQREFFPIQKLVVHHTATGSDQPDPTAAIRAIYYYHAVTQGWGDIGYNFLIDSAGRVYEGRASRDYAAGVWPSGDDGNGNGVEAGHARGYNAGSVGIGMLGTFDGTGPTATARAALIRTLAWAAARYSLDPRGRWMYTNPINGAQAETPNIAGHRDYNATACPGAVLYAQLPGIRDAVATELIERIGAADRYGTAAATSAAFFGMPGGDVLVATGAGFPDSIAGGPAAARVNGPILLVQRDAIPAATAAELARLRPTRIFVLGGSGVVSDGVLEQLRAYASVGVDRVAGPSRYETAAAISQAFFLPGVEMALVATGADFPDALSGGPAAARNDAPILLVRPDGVPAAVAAELTRLQPQRIIVLGGPGVVSEGVLAQLNAMAPGGAIRIAGANRYATSAAIASAFWLATRAAFVATGQNFPDALAAASPAARVDAPMLLVGSGVPAPIDAELRRLMPFRLYVLGGTGVVSDGVMAQVRGALGLP
jgi:hypothetical protein